MLRSFKVVSFCFWCQASFVLFFFCIGISLFVQKFDYVDGIIGGVENHAYLILECYNLNKKKKKKFKLF